MNYSQINIGAFLDDPTAERVRDAFEKVNNWGDFVESTLNPGTKVIEVFRPFSEAGVGISETQNICNIVNAYTPFTVPANQAGVISFVQFAGGVFGTEFTKYMYLLKVGAGTYGLGQTQLVPANLIKLAPIVSIPDPDFVYDLGNIGTTAVHTFVNGAGPYIVDGLTVFEAVQDGEDKIWLFVGGNGNYGDGATATVADDFVDLTGQDPIPSTPTFFLPVKKIESTPHTITNDDLNRPLWFTSNNQVVNVPSTFLDTNTNILLFNFEAYFSGTGTHTVNHPQGGVDTFSQGDYIKALRYDNSGATLWTVKKWDNDNDGQVDSVVGGTGIDVDATDPVNPVVNLDDATIASLELADTALQSGDNVSELVNDAGYITTIPADAEWLANFPSGLVKFDKHYSVGTPTSAQTGALTLDLTGARVGRTVLMYYTGTALPSFVTQWLQETDDNFIANETCYIGLHLHKLDGVNSVITGVVNNL